MWLIDSVDFRSEDGLYALLQAEGAGSTGDVVTEHRVAAEDGVVHGNADDSARPRRSGRSRKKTPSSSVSSKSTYHIDDPQDIMNINVFRNHPQVF
jgi:hypothetical protein